MIPTCLNTILNYTIKSSTSINSPAPLLTQGAPLTMARGNYKNRYGMLITVLHKKYNLQNKLLNCYHNMIIAITNHTKRDGQIIAVWLVVR